MVQKALRKDPSSIAEFPRVIPGQRVDTTLLTRLPLNIATSFDCMC